MEMESYEIDCKCGAGKMIRKRSNSEKNRGRMYYICPKAKKTETIGKWDWGCKHFLWEDVLTQSQSCGASSSGSSGKGKGTDGDDSSTPTPTTEEKRIKALSKALEISQTANRALVDLIHDLTLDDY
uniref:GRF-type domain-containing protein n=1 Tax=Daucus carota subsp. sativus TaxID=79200 RepID=A0A166AQA5_DAUCS|nr:PREDICTED: DNA topoisomerase 3-alpha-like [Daucus carota subsp. sativus]